MMSPSKCALVLAFGLVWPIVQGGVSAQEPATPQEPTPPPVEAGPPPISISLSDAVQMSLKNNLDIKVAHYTPEQRRLDIVVAEAVFDPNIGVRGEYQDISQPTLNRFFIPAFRQESLSGGFSDRLRYGGDYSANASLDYVKSGDLRSTFPVTYQAALNLAYNQSLLRNFGKKVNETQIVIAQNNQAISRSQFRQQVLDTLKATEDAYWELVFARQNLDVNKQALGLAEELLKLNRIKVQVGTLPPIEITQAEAEVANREQGVIVAENAVTDAEDILRRVMNLPKDEGSWDKPLAPTDEPSFFDRPVDLPGELETAINKRPDLEQARLELSNADTTMAFNRNQMKWDLRAAATYTLAGQSGDSPGTLQPLFCADDGIDGIPGTGDPGEGDGICENGQPATGATPPGPGETITSALFGAQNQGFNEALHQIRDREFESWTIALTLGIPLGNRAAESRYSSSRIAKEQSSIRYENARLNAEVQVRTAARAILTGKKRIEAAEKNVELQKKKVEAEQKKFENGMSTSFQVLTFQNDLITALGTKNRALVDYRKSLSALEQAKGTLDDYLKVSVE